MIKGVFMKTFIGTKSFCINESGKRQYCNAVVSFISSTLIQIKLHQNNQFEYSGLLSTFDGFQYSGRMNINGNEWVVSCRCFTKSPGILLFGEWKKDNSLYEFCIHATVQDVTNRTLSTVHPAA